MPNKTKWKIEKESIANKIIATALHYSTVYTNLWFESLIKSKGIRSRCALSEVKLIQINNRLIIDNGSLKER